MRMAWPLEAVTSNKKNIVRMKKSGVGGGAGDTQLENEKFVPNINGKSKGKRYFGRARNRWTILAQNTLGRYGFILLKNGRILSKTDLSIILHYRISLKKSAPW
jgi:hypothetical protein